jgi:serine phosphatase RsbU (regulator of sigma subunit)
MISDDAAFVPQDGGSSPGLPALHESFSIWSANANGETSGGDWCAIVPLSEHAVALSIGDVAGHGLAAAAELGIMHAAILNALTETRVPSDVLFAANAVAYHHPSPIIVTAIVAVFDRRQRTLTFANAGHPPPLVCGRDDHAFLAHAPADLPLGVLERHHAANFVVALPFDTLLVLYTDGITEHDRDPLRGEAELIDAVRWAFARPELDAARAVANHVLQGTRGDDDAATMVLRLSRVFHGIHDSQPAPKALR